MKRNFTFTSILSTSLILSSLCFTLGCTKPIKPSAIFPLNVYEVTRTEIAPDGKTAFLLINTPRKVKTSETSSWFFSDYKIQQYDLEQKKEISVLDLPEAQQGIVFSPDHTKFLTIEYDVMPTERKPTHKFHLRNINDGSVIQTFSAFAPFAPTVPNTIVEVGFLGDGKRLWSANRGYNNIYLWNLDGTIDFIIDPPNLLTSWAFSPDGKTAWYQSGNEYRIVDLVNKTDLVPAQQQKENIFFYIPWMKGFFSPDGTQLLVILTPENIKGHLRTDRLLLWDLKKKELKWTIPWPQPEGELPSEITSAHFLPDGQRIVIIATKMPTKVYSIEKGEFLSTISSNEDTGNYPFEHLAFSQDRQSFVGTPTYADIATVFDSSSGNPIHLLSMEKEDANYIIYEDHLVISPNGKRVIGYTCQAKSFSFLNEVIKDPLPCALRVWDLP